MLDNDLLYRSVTELARLVHSGQLSARELTTISLKRIETLDDRINAFSYLDAERALEVASNIKSGDPRPFAGVPIAIKDLFTAVKGLPQTQGSNFFKNYIPDYDKYIVRRLKEAGFVIIGTTNTSEFGILPVTEPQRFGPTRNPWDLNITPGGSSGGSAAAVAAGMVPLAHATDAAGSIRNPASCCGLVGLKPSRNRISVGPELGDQVLVTNGVLTRTVLETAQLLEVLSGYEPGDANWTPSATEPFSDLTLRSLHNQRIGILTTPPVECAVDGTYSTACINAGKVLEEYGHDVEECTFEWQNNLFSIFADLYTALIGSVVNFGIRINNREPSDSDLEPLTHKLYKRAKNMSALQYLALLTTMQSIARKVVAQCLKYDVIITPALAQLPVSIGTFSDLNNDPLATLARGFVDFAPFTWIWNMTGQPAVTLPFTQKNGVPIAIQLVGKPAGEGQLLALANQLEQLRPYNISSPRLTT